MIQAIKKAYPILDEKGRPCTFPTFASQVYMEDGTSVESAIQNISLNNDGDIQDGSCKVPSGGTIGQILAKTSDEDFATEWVDAPVNDINNVYVGCKMLYAIGRIINGASDVIEGHGNATVILYPNGLAEIHYSAQITKDGTATSSVFDWGINRDLLQNCNSEIPQITPMRGGYAIYHSNSDGTALNSSANGMAGVHAPVGQFWQFGRLYETPTSVGGWPTTMFKTGARIHGVCYGTYTPSIDDFVNEGLTGNPNNSGNTENTSGLSVNDIYPVGSIYMSVDSTSPASRFANTTWEQLKDRFLIGAGGSYSNGSTGGAAKVTIAEKNLPWNTVVLSQYGSKLGMYGRGDQNGSSVWGFTALSDAYKNASGGVYADGTNYNVAMDNMPPYLAVCMWRRVS